MFLQYIKAFFLIYIIAIGSMFYLSSKGSGPIVLPGDIYFRKGTKMIYFPLGSSFFLALILFILFIKFIAKYAIPQTPM